MPATEWGWMITPEELRRWILADTADKLVINKPGFVVCHPSKHGPWSSLVGACREYLGLERVHMPFRLDRETSGVVLAVKDRDTALRLHRAVERRRVRKVYWAILCGEMNEPITVCEPIGRDEHAEFACRQCVIEGGQASETGFVPVSTGGGFTLARVQPQTGRLHQIRVHAAWMGHPIAGDKLYGRDPSLMMEFVKHGFTARLAAALPLARQALHAAEVAFETPCGQEVFRAPLADDLMEFCRRMGIRTEAG